MDFVQVIIWAHQPNMAKVLKMLNMTKVELELIKDPDMYIFFEKGMRGEVSYISNRYSRTNKEYLISYGPKQKSKDIYLDTNNLMNWINILAIVQKDVFSKLILNILNSSENYTVIIH